jgi:VIT1/CCC1 family predicted Fe2+/Mn2+ transporter
MGNIYWSYCLISIALGWGGTIIGVYCVIDYFIKTNK